MAKLSRELVISTLEEGEEKSTLQIYHTVEAKVIYPISLSGVYSYLRKLVDEGWLSRREDRSNTKALRMNGGKPLIKYSLGPKGLILKKRLVRRSA